MKKFTTTALVIVVFGLSLFIYANQEDHTEAYTIGHPFLTNDNIEFPANVKEIIDNKCFDCHNSESKSAKSKGKLNFDKFTNGKYSTAKQVSKLGKIKKVLEKKKMPPAKAIKKWPELKLSPEEEQSLIQWADTQKAALAN